MKCDLCGKKQVSWTVRFDGESRVYKICCECYESAVKKELEKCG